MRYVLLLALVFQTQGCVSNTTHAIGECPDGASVYSVDAARWQIRLCSFSGVEAQDGICLEKGGQTECSPLCNNGGASLCEVGEQFQTFDQVCYCEAIP